MARGPGKKEAAPPKQPVPLWKGRMSDAWMKAADKALGGYPDPARALQAEDPEAGWHGWGELLDDSPGPLGRPRPSASSMRHSLALAGLWYGDVPVEATQEACAAALEAHCGWRVHSCRMTESWRSGDERIVIELRDDAPDSPVLVIEERGQMCCERRYLHTDDNLREMEGQVLRRVWCSGVHFGPSVYHGDPLSRIQPDVTFLKIQTDAQIFTIEARNNHNGAYGGFKLRMARNGRALLALERAIDALEQARCAQHWESEKLARDAWWAVDSRLGERLWAAVRTQWLPLAVEGPQTKAQREDMEQDGGWVPDLAP